MRVSRSHLYNADGLPGQVEAGVEQEREDERKGSVPTRVQTDITQTQTSKTEQKAR